MGVAHALNSIILQVIAHGVGSYSNINKRMVDRHKGHPNFMTPNQSPTTAIVFTALCA